MAIPTSWAEDSLTQYLDNFRCNQLATFSNKRSEVIDLITIDAMFLKFLDGAINPNPLFSLDFFRRSHSAFRAACSATLGGQLYETQSLLRVCLEQAGYAHYVSVEQERWELWISRHDSEEAKRKVRNLFSHAKVCRHLETSSSELADKYKYFYDLTIDYGAHPNERGASLSSKVVDHADGSKEHLTIFLHGDGIPLDFALKCVARIGLWALLAAENIYPNRFRAISVTYALHDMIKRF